MRMVYAEQESGIFFIQYGPKILLLFSYHRNLATNFDKNICHIVGLSPGVSLGPMI